MASPTEHHWPLLCRAATRLEQRLELVHTHQRWPDNSVVQVDNNWAPEHDHESVDEGFSFFGSHLIDGWSAPHGNHALSSAEAENTSSTTQFAACG